MIRPGQFLLYPLSYLILYCHLSSAYLYPQATCSTCLPNPIAETYPYNITGVINSTFSVILLPLPYARSLLPSQFTNSILTNAYHRFNIPPDVYPLVIETSIDHDIRYNNTPAVADFSAFRTTFPFIDLLGDGYSNFRYTGFIYLPPDNIPAINGSQGYGYTVLPAYFNPADAPYKFATRTGKAIISAVYRTSDPPKHSRLVASTRFRPTQSSSIPLSFYKNITNQPLFGNKSSVCDNMMSFWNTSVTTGNYEPQPLIGDVVLTPPMVPRRRVWSGIQGVKAQRAFLEVNYLPCETLKGYQGTGEGDSG
ncbi:MAG: hypothetical protein L6R40_003307 [Gallowayella cf. fulva]|nr:MAG: hypothetical protein L6R40_003307 [Xanthomendoza cf. fulva]